MAVGDPVSIGKRQRDFNGSPLNMQGEKKERWLELAAQAAVEQDAAKLLGFVKELNDLLEEKERAIGNPSILSG